MDALRLYGNEKHLTFPTCPRLSLVPIVIFNTCLKGIRVPNPYLLLAIVVHQLILSMCSTSSLWSATDMPRWLNLQSNQPLFSDTTWVESDIDRHNHLRWQYLFFKKTWINHDETYRMICRTNFPKIASQILIWPGPPQKSWKIND